jgi:hypothetical protein
VTLEQIMNHLYRHEINCAISCFWDGGWDVKLGDSINGFKAESCFDTLPECAAFLEARAREVWPQAFVSSDGDDAHGR